MSWTLTFFHFFLFLLYLFVFYGMLFGPGLAAWTFVWGPFQKCIEGPGVEIGVSHMQEKCFNCIFLSPILTSRTGFYATGSEKHLHSILLIHIWIESSWDIFIKLFMTKFQSTAFQPPSFHWHLHFNISRCSHVLFKKLLAIYCLKKSLLVFVSL